MHIACIYTLESGCVTKDNEKGKNNEFIVYLAEQCDLIWIVTIEAI